MFKCQEDQIQVLTVCVDEPHTGGRFDGASFGEPASGSQAFDLLRRGCFDLVLISTDLSDVSAWNFLGRLGAAHPHQKWALVSPVLTEQQEIAARALGATAIFDSAPTTAELLQVTARLRRRATAPRGRFSRDAALATGRWAMAM
jgi:DNA-binding NarL/FixJ family response regulator